MFTIQIITIYTTKIWCLLKQYHNLNVLTVVIYIVIILWHNGMSTLKMQKCTDMVHS